MKSKNNSKSKTFPDVLVKRWEDSDGVNFAIALARVTGWMLQVDWLTDDQHAQVEDMIPVRVYVETNRDVVFDFTGKKKVMAFHKYVILPIAAKRARPGAENISTRCYSEEKLLRLPLRVKPSEIEIEKATAAIQAHPTFLSSVPKRSNPEVPAHLASQFSHGRCVPFANAVSDKKNLPAAGIVVSKFISVCQSPFGFCHAVVLHPDGEVEDSWGKQRLEDVLERFYIVDYTMDEAIFIEQKENLVRKYPQDYQEAYELAATFVKDQN